MTTSRTRRIRHAPSALLAAAALAAPLLSGCGPAERKATRGCVIVDVSGSARAEITGLYLPGFQRFVQRLTQMGSGDVCFSFAAAGMSGGASAWAHFSCTEPDDRLRCQPQIRRSVAAAAGQLATAADGPSVLHGASELVEALGLIAQATKPGDEILLLSDAIQNSTLTGDFARLSTDLGAQGTDQLLDALQQRALLPDLAGRTLRIPYALTRASRPLRMSAARQQAVRAFWSRYAQRSGARLVFGGGDEAA